MLCNLLNVNWRFRGTCHHLQLQRTRQVKNQQRGSRKQSPAWLILWHRRWRRHPPLKYSMTFNEWRCIMIQKIELLITTTVRTSNHTLIILFFLKVTNHISQQLITDGNTVSYATILGVSKNKWDYRISTQQQAFLKFILLLISSTCGRYFYLTEF
jgi:hypothetical protein